MLKWIINEGCGNGYMIPKLLAKGAKQIKAIDSSPNMLEIAKNNISQWCPHLQDKVTSKNE